VYIKELTIALLLYFSISNNCQRENQIVENPKKQATHTPPLSTPIKTPSKIYPPSSLSNSTPYKSLKSLLKISKSFQIPKF